MQDRWKNQLQRHHKSLIGEKENHHHKQGNPDRRFVYPRSSYKRNLNIKLPKNAIPILEESYALKTGTFVTTGVLVFLFAKDVVTIKNEDPKVVQDEIDRLAKALGQADYGKKIGKIVGWIVENHYETEKDSLGNLSCTIDFLKLIREQKKIKIGEKWVEIPSDLFKSRKVFEKNIR